MARGAWPARVLTWACARCTLKESGPRSLAKSRWLATKNSRKAMKFPLLKKDKKKTRVHCAPLSVTVAPARTINLIDCGKIVGVHVLAAVSRDEADALARPALDVREESARARAVATDASGGEVDALGLFDPFARPRARPHSGSAAAVGGHLVWGVGPLCLPV